MSEPPETLLRLKVGEKVDKLEGLSEPPATSSVETGQKGGVNLVRTSSNFVGTNLKETLSEPPATSL